MVNPRPAALWARVREAVARLIGTAGPGRSDADLEEELRSHLAMAAAADEAGGGGRVARLASGGLAAALDAVRDQRRWPWLGDLGRDVRDGVRTLRRNPTFAVVSLVTLTIGMGATTGVFSVVNSVLLEPLAYPAPDRLVAVWLTAPGAPGVADVSGDLRLSDSMYFTFAEQNRTFDHLGVWYDAPVTVTGVADPEEIRALWVSDGTLDALDVAPALGRSLQSADQTPQASSVVLLGYGYWQRRFGGAATIVGQHITIDDVPREIVGVTAPGFALLNVTPDVVLPTRFDRSKARLPGFGYEGVGRLRPGVTLAQANTDIGRLVPIWMMSWPAAGGVDPHVYDAWHIAPTLRPLRVDVTGHVGPVLWVLFGTVTVLLVIACANVANLLLVRADGRQRELAVRAALGAGRSRIMRGLLVESALLGLAGGLLGLGLAQLGLRALVAINPPNLPRLAEVAIDGRVVAFAGGISLLATLAFGFLPAWRAAGPGIAGVLHSGGRTASESRDRRRLRDLLVVTQVALAFVLLIGSGLLMRTIQALGSVDPGFADAAHVQTLRISIPPALAPLKVFEEERAMVASLAAIPGVTAVGFGTTVPLDGTPPDWDDIMPEGRVYRPGEVPAFRMFKHISPGYFRAAGARLVAGRDYDWTDLERRRPLAIVSDSLARELWGSPARALGKRIRTLDTAPWREVIGVAGDIHENGVDAPPPATVYWPAYGDSFYNDTKPDVARDATFTIRTDRAGTAALMAEIRPAIWSVDRQVPLAGVRTLQELYARSIARTSFALTMLSLAAGIGLVLGLVGIYGLVAYAVAQRTREIGIRVALGAARGPLTAMFVRHSLLLVGAGVLLGLVGSAALTRLIAALLFGTRPLDPVTYLAVPVLLAVAAALASYLPARRAARVDPIRALRAE